MASLSWAGNTTQQHCPADGMVRRGGYGKVPRLQGSVPPTVVLLPTSFQSAEWQMPAGAGGSRAR